jgi:hypothetical protein
VRLGSDRTRKCPGGAGTPWGRHQEASPDAAPTLYTAAEIARLWREAMKDKSYRLPARPGGWPLPAGEAEAAHEGLVPRLRVLPRQARPLLRRPRARRPRAPRRHRAPRGVPRPPVGTPRHRRPAEGDPRREPGQPDATALRLLLTCGVRKSTLQRVQAAHTTRTLRPPRLLQVPRPAGQPARRPHAADRAGQGPRRPPRGLQFRHFDFGRRRLTTFVKGGKVQDGPDPRPRVLGRPRHPHARDRRPARPLPPPPPEHPPRQVRPGHEEGDRVPRPPLPRQADGRPRPPLLVVQAPRRRRRHPAPGSGPASGCTRPATPPASASSTAPATSRPSSGSSATPTSPRPGTSTSTGTSTSSRRRSSRSATTDGRRNRSPRPPTKPPQTGGFMEAAGIEPASADAPVRASTSVGCHCVSPAGR